MLPAISRNKRKPYRPETNNKYPCRRPTIEQNSSSDSELRGNDIPASAKSTGTEILLSAELITNLVEHFTSTSCSTLASMRSAATRAETELTKVTSKYTEHNQRKTELEATLQVALVNKKVEILEYMEQYTPEATLSDVQTTHTAITRASDDVMKIKTDFASEHSELVDRLSDCTVERIKLQEKASVIAERYQTLYTDLTETNEELHTVLRFTVAKVNCLRQQLEDEFSGFQAKLRPEKL